MPIGQWSTTASNNGSGAPPINWAEGQAPSTVNDSARQMMADVASWYQGAEWQNFGDVPTYISANSFSIPGNRASVYNPGRRIEAVGTGYTIVGTIQTSVFTTVTAVTVAWDSGSLDNTLFGVALSILQGLLSYLMPSGTLIDFAGTSPPKGFLNCDGSAVSRTTYANLFAAIGGTWGSGDGSTTFNLPNLQRKATIGAGGTAISGPGNSVGATGGEELHTLSQAELPSHNHSIIDPSHNHPYTDPGHNHGANGGGGFLTTAGGGANLNTSGGFSVATPSSTANAVTGIGITAANTGITINNSGGSGPHNNMQPSAVVMKCIKY